MALMFVGFLLDTLIIKKFEQRQAERAQAREQARLEQEQKQESERLEQERDNALAVSRYEAQLEKLAEVRAACADLFTARRKLLICPHSDPQRCEDHFAQARKREIALAFELDWSAPFAFSYRYSAAELASDILTQHILESQTNDRYAQDLTFAKDCSGHEARRSPQCQDLLLERWCDIKALNYCVEYLACLTVDVDIKNRDQAAKLNPNPSYEFEPMQLDPFCRDVLSKREEICADPKMSTDPKTFEQVRMAVHPLCGPDSTESSDQG